MTITEALNSLGETLAKKGFSSLDLNCEDDEDMIIYALQYMENHIDDIFFDAETKSEVED